jgi:predicted 2-oxoglutarate/Fe(II)-dependent dioxygenase YbiX/peroxiredoxin
MTPRPIATGEPLPWFAAATRQNPTFRVDTLGGRALVLAAFGSFGNAAIAGAVEELLAAQDRLAEAGGLLCGLTIEPAAAATPTLQDRFRGPLFLDGDLAVARQLGLVGEAAGSTTFHPLCYIIDRRLRVAATLPLRGADAPGRVLAALNEIAADPPDIPAPVLVIPRVFEPGFCQELIALYERQGGEESGFMRSDAQGRTVYAFDPSHKRRRDLTVEDEALKTAIRTRVARRVTPEIRRAFQFETTRIERYLIACYAAADGGHFRAHRDNTTKGTAHRRFAVSINLDTSRHEGGDLRFPEFGERLYRPPSGGAVVFSCSVLHEATPVREGLRYCVLPFLYDDAAAAIREANKQFIVEKPAEASA